MWRADILQELQLGCIICAEAPVIQFIQIKDTPQMQELIAKYQPFAGKKKALS